MKKIVATLLVLFVSFFYEMAFSQQTKGTAISVSGVGEVKADNDEAKATFFVEEQDNDKSAAASRVNKKMKEGTELLKKLDPDGKYTTRGYYTYPIYSEPVSGTKTRTITSWRVGQYLDLTTRNIVQLPTTVAAAQQILALNGLHFELSEEATKNLEEKRLLSAYKNLLERVQIIAKAMGRDASEATFESLDFDGSGARFQPQPRAFAAAASMKAGSAVEETSFEPGETTLNATVLAKVKFN